MNTSKKNICLDKKTMCTEKVFYFYEIFVFIPKLGIVRQTVWLAISLFCYTISIMIFSSRHFTMSFTTSGMIKVIIYPIFFIQKIMFNKKVNVKTLHDICVKRKDSIFY